MAKTIEVGEDTWKRMKRLLENGEAKTFDELIRKLLDGGLKTPRSLFGIDKELKVTLTQKEHEEMSKDSH